MPDSLILVGDVREQLARLPDKCVSCCVTSPPYWALRKYDAPDVVWGGDADCGHEWGEPHPGDARGGSGPGAKETGNGYGRDESRGNTCALCGAWRGQYGLEPTPELYVEHTLLVLRAIRRVLRDDGVVFWNIGDGYAGSWGNSGARKGVQRSRQEERLPREAWDNYTDRPPTSYPQKDLKPKDLVLMPFRVALAAQADGWFVRSDIIWQKPNTMPESVRDRPTKAHEYIFMLTKSAKYWWDREAVREPASESSIARISQPTFDQQKGGPKDYAKTGVNRNRSARKALEGFAKNPGRNIRTVWTFPTAQCKEAHFAVFPEELPRKCVLASCPPEICSKCGTARVRVVEVKPRTFAREPAHHPGNTPTKVDSTGWEPPDPQTVGWTSCGCEEPDYQPGVVLDPFCGTGTTGRVAKELGRKFVGIELSPKYAEMAEKKINEK